jgi:hypothetical protein
MMKRIYIAGATDTMFQLYSERVHTMGYDAIAPSHGDDLVCRIHMINECDALLYLGINVRFAFMEYCIAEEYGKDIFYLTGKTETMIQLHKETCLACGIPLSELNSRVRVQHIVIGRILFTHFALEEAHATINDVSGYLRQTEKVIKYYMKQYCSLHLYNAQFRRLECAIRERMESNGN